MPHGIVCNHEGKTFRRYDVLKKSLKSLGIVLVVRQPKGNSNFFIY